MKTFREIVETCVIREEKAPHHLKVGEQVVHKHLHVQEHDGPDFHPIVGKVTKVSGGTHVHVKWDSHQGHTDYGPEEVHHKHLESVANPSWKKKKS